MGGTLWRASVENTAVPGGPLALQVKPALNVSRVEFYTSADRLLEGRPKNYDWQTNVLGIHEVEIQPTDYVSPGTTARPVVGRIAPAWIPTTYAHLSPISGNVSWRSPTGITPAGTLCGGPTFGSQLVMPKAGGTIHKLVRMRYVWPQTAPFIVYGCGTFDFGAGDTVLPEPAFVLYMPGTNRQVPRIAVVLPTITRPQTFQGAVVFEEM